MKETWYFTFGVGHPLKDRLQPIQGSYEQARETMIAAYDHKWCGQYPAEKAQELMAEYDYQLLPVVEAYV